MKLAATNRWLLLIVANVLFCFVLGLYRPGSAQNKVHREPFANSVGQRAEIIVELKRISALLSEQNTLLRSGKLKVEIDSK